MGGGALVVIWIVSIALGVGLWAYAEIIAVVLAIEENTFETRQALAAPTRSASQPAGETWRAGGDGGDSTWSLSRPAPSAPMQRPRSAERSLRLTPSTGIPGASITAQIGGFPPGAVIALTWFEDNGSPHAVARVNATPQGNASVTFTVPETETAGSRRVEAAASGSAKTTAVFNVVVPAGTPAGAG